MRLGVLASLVSVLVANLQTYLVLGPPVKKRDGSGKVTAVEDGHSLAEQAAEYEVLG